MTPRRALLVVVLAAGLSVAACGNPAARPGSPPALHATVGSLGTTAPTGTSVPPSTVVATLHASIPRFVAPGGAQNGTVPGSWYSSPSALPVVGSRPGWLQVRLAQRPNGSTAWVLASDVALGGC